MMRAIWAVKEAGGDQSVPFSDNGLWWPQFSFKLHKQYLIWKLTYLAKIWYPIEMGPIEIAEVEIAASGGRRSGQGPGEKKFDQKFGNPQILSYTNIIHLKRKLRTIFIQIWNKIWGLCCKKVEKKSILWFSIPKNHDLGSVFAEFLENLSR